MSTSIQLMYIEELIKRMNHIIPTGESHLFHVIFGDRIIGTYKTESEMRYHVKHAFKNICVALYIPKDYLTTKIQSLWRGHKSRGETRALMNWWHQEWKYLQENKATISA